MLYCCVCKLQLQIWSCCQYLHVVKLQLLSVKIGADTQIQQGGSVLIVCVSIATPIRKACFGTFEFETIRIEGMTASATNCQKLVLAVATCCHLFIYTMFVTLHLIQTCSTFVHTIVISTYYKGPNISIQGAQFKYMGTDLFSRAPHPTQF